MLVFSGIQIQIKYQVTKDSSPDIPKNVTEFHI